MAKDTLDEMTVNMLAREYESKHPLDILSEAVDRIPKLTFACSFGAEDMVILDMLMRTHRDVHVFYLDTNVLFPKTYELIRQAVAKYQIPNLIRVQPALSLSKQAELHGESLWQRDPNQCCSIRKVKPLIEHLSKYDGWVTGIRRDQAPTRAHAQVFEFDQKFKLIKVNPLVLWTQEDVWTYIREQDVIYNPLHDSGYPSIGCIHCTRPVTDGEAERGGRWAGFDKTECGLHE